MADFEFGSYAPYIWTAFAVTGAVLGWMVIDTLLAARRCRTKAKQLGLEDDWA